MTVSRPSISSLTDNLKVIVALRLLVKCPRRIKSQVNVPIAQVAFPVLFVKNLALFLRSIGSGQFVEELLNVLLAVRHRFCVDRARGAVFVYPLFVEARLVDEEIGEDDFLLRNFAAAVEDFRGLGLSRRSGL